MDIRDIPVYVAHYTPAADRKRFMARQLADVGFRQVTFIESFDREALTESDLAAYDPSPEKSRQRSAETRTVILENAVFNGSKKSWSEGVDYSSPLPPPKRLTPAEISLALKHRAAFQNIVVGHAPFALVLEDDAIFLKGFASALERNLRLTPDDWQLIFIGSGCRLRVPERQDGIYVYKMSPPRSKCCDSFLIKREAAAAISCRLIPFVQPIDWELNYWMHKLDLSTYWCEPPIVAQGSEIGAFKSTIGR